MEASDAGHGEARVAEEAPPVFRLEGVSKIYRMGEVDVPALRDATLDVRAGEFLIVAGPSGSGKTTLLNLIGGMDRPSSGTILFEGRDISRASDRELTRFRRRQVGFIFQFFNLIPTLTALENVQVTTEIADDPMDGAEALRLVGLDERAGHFPGQLSGGEQQRVAIARALAGRPRVILCDEPTGALDVETGKQVLSILAALSRDRGETVVVITHNNAIAALGDRVARMKDGRVEEVSEQRPKTVDEIHW